MNLLVSRKYAKKYLLVAITIAKFLALIVFTTSFVMIWLSMSNDSQHVPSDT